VTPGPRGAPELGQSRERWVRSSTLRLCQADPEVSSFGLYADAATGATILRNEGARTGGIPCGRSSREPADPAAAVRVSRVATAEGLVLATNRLLVGLGLPDRLVAISSTDGMVVCISVKTAATATLPAELDFAEPTEEVEESGVFPDCYSDELADVA